MNDTSLHDTSGGAGSANTVRGRSGNAEGPSGSHYIIRPLQKASGQRQKKTAMSHFWNTHHKVVPFSSCTNCQHMPALKSVLLFQSAENRTFFGETRTPPLQPQMTSSLHTKGRDPPNLFAERNGTHSSVGSPSTAHLYRKDTAQTLRFQAFRHTGRAA